MIQIAAFNGPSLLSRCIELSVMNGTHLNMPSLVLL